LNFKQTLLAAIVALSATSAMAGPTLTFDTSVGIQPDDVGIITLTQNGADTVTVLVDLLPGYGFINTGGPHTPFAFNLAGSEAGLSITSFLQPVGGVYSFGTFSINTGGGDNQPYGSYGVAIDSTARNGSGKGYFGDLQFNLTRVGGLSTTDFLANANGYYFSADISNGVNTGAQAWALTSVPEPESYAMMLAGLGLMGFVVRRRKNRTA
jgi:hypothetical protein